MLNIHVYMKIIDKVEAKYQLVKWIAIVYIILGILYFTIDYQKIIDSFGLIIFPEEKYTLRSNDPRWYWVYLVILFWPLYWLVLNWTGYN